jgi:hypothetical protein
VGGLARIVAALAATAVPLAYDVHVSRAHGPQSEASIALDPSDPDILLAGSNDGFRPGGRMRAYSSSDGGATWRDDPAPPLPPGVRGCADGDPSVTIDGHGRQAYSFLVASPCPGGVRPVRVFVAVARRSGPSGIWRTVAPLGTAPDSAPPLLAGTTPATADDRPTMIVDPLRDRLVLAWTAIPATGNRVIVLSTSDDGGATWSRASRVTTSTDLPAQASLAAGRGDDLYVAWGDIGDRSLYGARSRDGGATFGPPRLLARVGRPAPRGCFGLAVSIPAQPFRCVDPDPVISFDPAARRAYLTYGTAGPNGAQDVFAAAFDERLRPIRPPVRVNARDGRVAADQFLPFSALDHETGRLWVCFYDTRGDRTRRSAVFSCSVSSNGAATFGRAFPVASVRSLEGAGADRHGFGDYEGLAVGAGVAHPAWTDSRDLAKLGEEIYTATLDENAVRCASTC